LDSRVWGWILDRERTKITKGRGLDWKGSGCGVVLQQWVGKVLNAVQWGESRGRGRNGNDTTIIYQGRNKSFGRQTDYLEVSHKTDFLKIIFNSVLE
jgi:hypothetical protein